MSPILDDGSKVLEAVLKLLLLGKKAVDSVSPVVMVVVSTLLLVEIIGDSEEDGDITGGVLGDNGDDDCENVFVDVDVNTLGVADSAECCSDASSVVLSGLG